MTPGPWHDAIAHHYSELRKFAPQLGAEYLAAKHGITPRQVLRIWLSCQFRGENGRWNRWNDARG